jgi:copper(I)-binding protein
MFRRVLAVSAPLLIGLVAAIAAPVLAHEVTKGDVVLSNLEVRASLGVNPNTGGYLTVENRGAAADELVGVTCACARTVQLHVMSMSGQVMSMRQVQRLAVPAHGKLELKPGGAHLMILGLKQPLKDGEKVNMTLTFRRAGKVETFFHVVTQPGANAPAAPHQH